MAGATQDHRAGCDASSRPARSCHRYGRQSVCRGSIRGTVLAVEVSPINVRDAGEIERTVTAFARVPNSGLIVTRSGLAHVHQDLIINLAARHKLPAIYFERSFVDGGGLISYGPDLADQYKRAAIYVDRILKGEKPANLPVQSATKFQLVINIKTAKALGARRAGASPADR